MAVATTSVADDEEDAMSTPTTNPAPANPTTVTLPRKVLGAVLLAAAVLGGGIATARSAAPAGAPAGPPGSPASALSLPEGADLAAGEVDLPVEGDVVLDGELGAMEEGFIGDPASSAFPADDVFDEGTHLEDGFGEFSATGFEDGAAEGLPGGPWEGEDDRSAPPVEESPAADPAVEAATELDPAGVDGPVDDAIGAEPAPDPAPGGVAPVLPSRTIERRVAVGQRVELFSDAALAAGWHDPDGSADWLCLEFRPERRDFWLDGADCTGAGLWTRIPVAGTYVVRIRAVEVQADAPSEAGLRSEGEIVLRLIAG